MTPETQITAKTICDALGRAELAQELGVGRTAISNAAVEGRFPAKWFMVVKAKCEAQGIECPSSLFNFVDPAPQPPAEDAA